MTPVTCFSGKRVALFGLGGSGLATARALRAGGATVVCGDDGAQALETARAEGFVTADLAATTWSGIAALVLAPGVPLTHKAGKPFMHPVVARARAAGAEVIGDIELFCREREKIAPNAPFIAITGTNGKSTTTALIAHILRGAGFDVQMGGNIGRPILDLEPPADGKRIHVIECSSFQIDLAPSLEPEVGVLLNLTPDHLDRHGTMERYAAIKERLIAGSDESVVSVDDPLCAAIAERHRNMDRISTERPLAHGFYAEGTKIVFKVKGREPIDVVDIAGIPTLRGRHNLQNAIAAVAAVLIYNHFVATDWDEYLAPIRTFPGLPHRLEQVGRLGRVLFINDSKATNADSTEKALLAFSSDIHWIVGGTMKEGGIAALAPRFSRVAKAYLIGASTDAFAETLDGKLRYERCGTLDIALAAAARDAAASGAAEPVVLLSPACASYDQFKNFEERGDLFRDLVSKTPLPEGEGQG